MDGMESTATGGGTTSGGDVWATGPWDFILYLARGDRHPQDEPERMLWEGKGWRTEECWGHSLDVLLKNVEETFPDLAALSSDAESLNDYYENTRYLDSSPFEKYGEGEATEALRAAERIFTAARENIPAPAE